LERRINDSEILIKDLNTSTRDLVIEMKNFISERKLTPEPAFKAILLGNLYSQQLDQLSICQEKLSDLERKLINVKQCRVLNPPDAPKFPIKPAQSDVNIIYIFALAGLILGLMAAFLAEYIQKSKLIEYVKKTN
jgi:hypothetical protein